MSDWSIRLNRLVISGICLLCFACVLGSIRPARRVTEPDKVEQHQLVQEEIYTHLDNIYDSLSLFTTAFYPQFGTDTIGVLGAKTMYLDRKYASTDYQVLLTAVGNSEQSVTLVYFILSDSSYNVFADSINVTFSWYTIGAI